MGIHQATQEHEAFYHEVCAEMQRACKRHPSIRNLEIIACLARTLGYGIAACYPDERDIARHTAIMNIDQAAKDVALDGPSTAGAA
jgi:hypothetical protein